MSENEKNVNEQAEENVEQPENQPENKAGETVDEKTAAEDKAEMTEQTGENAETAAEPTEEAAEPAAETTEKEEVTPEPVAETEEPAREEVQPETVEPEAAKAEEVEPETVEPETAKAEEVESETVEPETAEAEAVEPDEPVMEEVEPETVEPEAAKEEEQTDEAPQTDVEAVKTGEDIPPETEKPAAKTEPGAFDWDAIGKKQELYSKEERNRLEKVYDKTLSSINEHEVIEGTVVSKSNRELVVNIGYKSDGVIPISEVRYMPDIKSGDPIDVYVESQEDTGGQLILSHKKARILKSWERINQAFDKDEIITGYVKSRTKGGLIVDVFGIEAFLPGSQIDVKPIRDYDVFLDKTMEFKVVKINQEYKNVVVSHKALIEAELEQQKAEIMSKLEKGQVLEGTVKNITSYGVFIDLGGVDGLIHITDLSWGRINHPEEIVQLDEKIKVVILDFDDEKKRIALGLKQLTAHPWDSLSEDLKVGNKVKGKVVVIADYGAFVEIAPGVEGLIHVSEMSWSQHLRTAHDFLKVGDEVEAVILTLDRDERKMSLGMKQLIPDPWEDIGIKYPVNSRHTATVRNFTNFGIFVELEEGVDGLIHISDLSWSKKIKHPAEFTKIGEEIEVVVLDVDSENRRLSLGHKQLEENPWDVFETVFTVGSVHSGTVVSANDKGLIVSLPYGVEGFVPSRHSVKQDGSHVKVDTTEDFKVIEFSKDNKKIILSHTRIHQDDMRSDRDRTDDRAKKDQRSTKRAVRKIQDNIERTTLGDLEALASLKEDMEKQEKKAKAKKKTETTETTPAQEDKPAAETDVKKEEVKEEKAEDKKAEKKEKKEKAEDEAEDKKEEKVEAKEEEKAEEKEEEKVEMKKPEEEEKEEEKKDEEKDEEEAKEK
jgi:small subunit ribosomal protein S1